MQTVLYLYIYIYNFKSFFFNILLYLVFLLDDPLSACDSEVGSKLFHECIMENLRSKNKGIVLCTHQLQYLNYSDKIVVLNREGKQQFYGTYDEFYSQRHLFDFFDFNNIDTSVSCGSMLKSNSCSRLNTTDGIQVLDTSYSIEASLDSRKKRMANESNMPISSDKDSGSIMCAYIQYQIKFYVIRIFVFLVFWFLR